MIAYVAWEGVKQSINASYAIIGTNTKTKTPKAEDKKKKASKQPKTKTKTSKEEQQSDAPSFAPTACNGSFCVGTDACLGNTGECVLYKYEYEYEMSD